MEELGTETPEGVTMRRQEVLKKLECPVCYDLIFPPVKDCCNGHSLCSSCLQRVDNCPICKEPAGITQNRFAEDFLEKYIKRCHNHLAGCKEYFWKEQEKTEKEHGRVCKFRTLQCWFPNCDVQEIQECLLNHWKCDHDILESESSETDFNFSFGPNSPVYDKKAFILRRDGNIFFLIFERAKSHALLYTYAYCPKESFHICIYETLITVDGCAVHESEDFKKFEYRWQGPVCHECIGPQDIKTLKKGCLLELPPFQQVYQAKVNIVTKQNSALI